MAACQVAGSVTKHGTRSDADDVLAVGKVAGPVGVTKLGEGRCELLGATGGC